MPPETPSLRSRFFSWADRAFKTDTRYLVGAGGWSLVAQAVASFSTLGLSVVISHFVPKEVYGEYKYVLALIGILSLFSLNDLSSAVLQSTARGFDRALPDGFRINLKWSLVIFVGALALAAYYVFGGNLRLAMGVLIGGALTPLMGSANLALAYLSGKKDFRRAALYGSIFGSTLPAAAIALVAFFAPSPLSLLLAYFGANAATDLLFYYLTVRRYKPSQGTSDPGMKRFGKDLSIIGTIVGLVQYVDQVLVFHFLGPIELAVYAFSIGIVDQARGPMKALDAMVRARFADQPDRSIRAGMSNKLMLLAVGIVACIFAYIAAAPYIYGLLFPSYHEAVGYSQLYALTLFGMLLTPMASYLYAKKKTKALYVDSVLISGLQIVLMTIGVVYFGLWGLIVARVITRFADITLVFFLYGTAVRKEA